MPFPYPFPYWNMQNMPNMNPNFGNPYFINGEMAQFNQNQGYQMMMPNNNNQKSKNINKKSNNKTKPNKVNANANKLNNKNNNYKNATNNNLKDKKIKNEEAPKKNEKNSKKNQDTKKETPKESENQKSCKNDSTELCGEESKITDTKSILINDSNSNTAKTNKLENTSKVGYLTQLKREKEKEIKKLEEKELKPKRPTKSKIVIISKDKKKNNNYENPSEIKMGRIYTTLNQNNKKVKSKAKSVQKGKINSTNNNIINENLLLNLLNSEQNLTNNNELENLFQKNMEFAGKVNEIKEFLKK
jgi:hypothetical protein